MWRPLSFLQLQPVIHSGDVGSTPRLRTFLLMNVKWAGGEVLSMSLKRVTWGPRRVRKFRRNCTRRAASSRWTCAATVVCIRCTSGLTSRLKMFWPQMGAGEEVACSIRRILLREATRFSSQWSSRTVYNSRFVPSTRFSPSISKSSSCSDVVRLRFLSEAGADCRRYSGRLAKWTESSSSRLIMSAGLGLQTRLSTFELNTISACCPFVYQLCNCVTDRL